MPDWKQRMEWDLAFARKSARTQKIYLADAKAFAAFQGRSPEELGQEEVRIWVEHLVERKVSPSRLRQHLAALVFLFRKTMGMPQAVSFFSWPNDPEPLPVVLSPGEVSRLLAAMPTPAYRMLFCTMYASGLRILEACRLMVSDLDGDRGAIRVLGKGQKERLAALHPPLLAELRAYWHTYRPVAPWLFTGRYGLPLDPDQARKVFKAAAGHGSCQAGNSAFPAPHLCHLVAGARHGPSGHPGPARPWRALQYRALPACGHPHDQGQRGPHGTPPSALIRGRDSHPPQRRTEAAPPSHR